MSIQLKSRADLEKMRYASMVVYQVHEQLKELIKPGVCTLELDEVARKICEKEKVAPAFLNYPCSQKNGIPFPGVICASPNEVIVHGIPDNKPLKDGDILSVDFGCCYEGFYGDSARTYPIGKISESARKLLDVTEHSLELAIEQCFTGKRIGDISHAVQSYVEKHGFGIVREFVGHGIGRKMHEPPHVPNFGRASQGRPLKVGLVLAIEPMVTVGSYNIKVLSDNWTAVTSDGSLSAHYEHTVAITDKGPWVLSRP